MNEDSFEKRLKSLPPEMAERQRAARAKAQEALTRSNERTARLFQLTDAVHGADRTPQGNVDPNSVFTIRNWQNPNGDAIYLRYTQTQPQRDLSQDEMFTLSTQIKTEQDAFRKLTPSEQTKIRKEGSPQFNAYLSNEVLKEQFRKLK